MRGDDCVFVFSIAHGGVCQGVCPLFFEFYEEIQKLFTRAFPPRTPRHPKLKFGEVVEVIILLYYLGCRTQKKKSVLLGDFARPCGKARAGGQKKKEENTHVLQNSYLCARIAFRFFLCAFINLAAPKAAIEIASNAFNYRYSIH